VNNDPRRIDPPTCGCTDCITGYSKPMDEATDQELWQMMIGLKQNATGFDVHEFSLETVTKIRRPT
jgi:hypothetical protein